MGEDSFRLMTQLLNNIYGNGQWPKDFIEVAVIALKKPQATECWDSGTYSKEGYLEEGIKGNLKMYWEKIIMDLEEEKGQGMYLGC